MSGHAVRLLEEEAAICEINGSGLLLPLGGNDEQEWDKSLRIVLYLLGLLWCFLGVAIVSDVFMSAIEEVTSKKKRVLVKDEQTAEGKPRYMTVKVWNDTVANLTLMALGSSAPEILLSVIELFSADFYSGALGPSTIVGSAAFNLLCIVAVCVYAIPDGEGRKIKDTNVFAVTATFSLWAYIWLIVILMASSPDCVEPWEGALTFLFFPLLVIMAFLADIGYFSGNRGEATHKRVVAADMTQEELATYISKVRRQHGVELSDEQVMKIIEHETAQPMSRAAHRVAATREMTGAKKVKHTQTQDEKSFSVSKVNDTGDEKAERNRRGSVDIRKSIRVEFAADRYSVLESCKECVIPLIKQGGEAGMVTTVKYATRDGTAQAGQDYVTTEGTVEFKEGIDDKYEIRIPIIDDVAYEEDEDFYVDITSVTFTTTTGTEYMVVGENKVATITIIDDDEPGVLAFENESVDFTEKTEDTTLQVKVLRKHGSTGKISCHYSTENDSAVSPTDFDAADGEITFESGQMSACIDVLIKAKGRYEGHEMFRLNLSDPKGGAKFDHSTDGGNDMNICSICIWADSNQKQAVDAMAKVLKLNWDKARIGTSNWADQFANAMKVNGGEDDDGSTPSAGDYFLHVASLPWKLTFALIPPTDYGGGWVCFCIALVFIGGVTAIIGDMAGLLGCCMGVPDSITAITFVALGTSLPDTFASKSAAVQDEYADASIGNVTGSNSVNVFLGLGMPWLIGSIYWYGNPSDKWKAKYPELSQIYPEGRFIVQSGDLGFSVTVFTIVAIICIGCLLVRRKICGYELGGPKGLKIISSIFFVCLWFVYIGLSSWNALQSGS
eukprot:gnl/MRDRNA2_/MRDRNA2_29066_c0_seq2.p1 gnl/MRDRNA2_/MRDRNA2_29066_c0~~gnl/MRDRNA2_/MRDRNA2_29066_c0_seq2.p1  ORF type:complete len:840 (+),score=144.17 gnl/MRDRNA2_/MRDRNA2_29066_c0_seq2:108-2627(+)